VALKFSTVNEKVGNQKVPNFPLSSSGFEILHS